MDPQAPSSVAGWTRGLSWNFVALAFAAVTGLTANLLLAKDFGPAGFGVFSQTLTWFALMAQIAALGVHYAVLHQTAIATTLDEAREAVDAGVTVVAVVSTLAAAISYLAAPLVSAAVASPPLIETIRFASVALILHALAKVVSAGLNGTRRMTAFSSVAAARAAGMLFAVVLLGASESPVGRLGLVFVASEVAALSVAVIAWGRIRPLLSLQYPRYLARFGARAAIAAVTVEANSRIDIAVLGVVASDNVVGVYTLAATAFEGTFQIFVVLRNQVNPTVASAVSDSRPEKIDALFRQLRPWTWMVAGGVLALATTTVVPLVQTFGLSTSFVEAKGPLIILLAGLMVAAPLLPFDQLLVIGGKPGAQSRVVVASLGVNLTLSIALVPWLGGIGAAIGTVGAILTLVAGVSRGGRRLLGTTFGLWPSLPLKPMSSPP